MSNKTIIYPERGMVAKFGSKPGSAPDKTRCMGASIDGVCRERSTCALHLLQLKDPQAHAMRIGRVGANSCSYRVEVVV